MRRSGDKIGVTVHFISNITLQNKKELLSNKQNKQILWLVVSYTGTHMSARSIWQEDMPMSLLYKQRYQHQLNK